MKKFITVSLLLILLFSLESCFFLFEHFSTINLNVENKTKYRIDSIQICELVKDTALINSIWFDGSLPPNSNLRVSKFLGGLERKVDFKLIVFFSNGKKLASNKASFNNKYEEENVIVNENDIRIEDSHLRKILNKLYFVLWLIPIIFFIKILPLIYFLQPDDSIIFTFKYLLINYIILLLLVLLFYFYIPDDFSGILLPICFYMALTFLADYYWMRKDNNLEGTENLGMKLLKMNLFYYFVGINAISYIWLFYH